MAQTKRINLYLNGKQVEGTIGNLRKKARELNNELNQLEPGTKKYLNKVNELKKVNKDLDLHRNKIRGVNKGLGGIGGLINKLGPVGLAVGAIGTAAVAMGKKFVEAFQKQQKAIAKVEQAIKSTGGAAKLSLNELEKEASRLQSNTLFGDEDILNNVTAQLLTFTNITGSEFKRTQQVALDLATVLDGDVKSASIQLGKALNDPIANLSALSRSGIQFSKEQKELIKSLAETNQMAEAQNVILEELERQYGGQAAAAAKADGGFQQLSNELGDVGEELGEVLFPALKWVVDGLRDMVSWLSRTVKAFKNWDIQSLTAAGAEFVDTLTFGLIPGLSESTRKLNAKIAAQEHAREIFEETTDAVNEQGKQFNVLIETLKSSNTTDEQKAQAIDILNDKYGEYIGQIDLTKASTEELNAVQIEANKQIIESTIARQKQIYMEQAIQEQIKGTQKIIAATGQQYSILGKEIDTSQEAIDAAIAKNTSQIKERLETDLEIITATGEHLQKLEESGGGLATFGAAITVPDQVINASREKLNAATEELARLVGPDLANKIAAGNAESKAAYEKALELASPKHVKNAKILIDASLGAIKEAQFSQEKALDEAVSFGQGVDQATTATVENTKKSFEKLSKELEKIQQKVKEFQQDNANQAAIASANSEEEAELIKLDQKLAKKYDKEIAAAEKLAEGKGEIAQQAQEALNSLLIAKTEEYEREKASIEKKYLDIRTKLEQEAVEQRSTLAVQAQESQLNLEYMQAIYYADQISDREVAIKEEALRIVEQKRQAIQEFRLQQTIQGFEDEKNANIDILTTQLEQELITKSEYNALKFEQEQAFLAQKKEAELQYRTDLEQKDIEITERERARREQTVNEISNMASQIFGTISAFREAQLNMDIAREEQANALVMKNLEDQLNQGIINEETFAEKKEAIESNLQQNVKRIKQQAAIKDKQAAVIESIINTAVEVTKALATPPLSAAIGIAGAAQTALIASQPIPQFAEGGYHQVKGADDGQTYNAKYIGTHSGGMLPGEPSLVLASEKGAEYFVPHNLLGHPQVADYVGMIEAIRTNRQFAEGGYTQDVTPTPVFSPTSSSSSAENSMINARLITTIEKNSAVMSMLLEKGVIAKIPDTTVQGITEKQGEINEINGGFS